MRTTHSAKRREAFDAMVARAAGLHALGRFEAALAVSTEALEAATTVGHPPTLAVALYRRGVAAGKLDEFVGARNFLQRSFAMAMRGQDDKTAALAATSLAKYTGQDDGRLEVGETWVQIAEAFLLRAHLDRGPRHADLLLQRAALAIMAGRSELAIAVAEEGIAILEAVQPRNDAALPDALMVLAGALLETKKFGRAATLLERSLGLARSSLGPRHPFVGTVLTNLGAAAAYGGDAAASLSYLQAAHALFVASLGPDHGHTERVLGSLGLAYRDNGRLDEAKVACRRSLAMARFGADHPHTAQAHFNFGTVLADTADPERARHQFQSALEVWVPRFGPDHRLSSMAATALRRLDEADPTAG